MSLLESATSDGSITTGGSTPSLATMLFNNLPQRGSGSPLGTFNPLFPTGFYFGQGGISLLGPLNLFEVGPHVSVQLTRSLSVVADDHTFWRTSLQDGVYGLGINLLVSGQANSGRYIGNQPSVGVYWNAGRHLSVSAAYAHFFVGTFLPKASAPGRDVEYGGYGRRISSSV